MDVFDVVVIGAGASGLMCAMTAARRGRKVLVLESSNKIGKKILMSGGGRCNFTNYTIEAENYICHNPHFVKSALSQYTQWDFIALVQKYGIEFHEREHGQLFCNDSSKEILNLLKTECDETGVDIRLRCDCKSVAYQDGYLLKTSQGEFHCQSLVVASGGLSIPTLGSTGYGYELARQFGHQVLSVRAGLVPFTFSDWFKSLSEKLSGIAIRATVKTATQSFSENILFTHRGLSGPAVLQISNYWQEGQDVNINLLPDADVTEMLLDLKQQRAKSLLKNLLANYLPVSLILELEKKFWPEYAGKSIAEIPDVALKKVASSITDLKLKPSGTEGYRTAEVTLNGVDTAGISSKTMESKLSPGVYFVGEVLDVTGHLGGYNFQWAWSSGYVAGASA
ncbi:MAG: NAD(P)/FAD-dependent oxidoreductase [Gammaproteobacteria bacterium]|nr:NAD(P)/FAD-dependent oxidoreductase [Gammaproteobacteria bacterium]